MSHAGDRIVLAEQTPDRGRASTPAAGSEIERRSDDGSHDGRSQRVQENAQLELLLGPDVMTAPAPAPSLRSTRTHEIVNVFDPLVHDAYESDAVLSDVIARAGASWAEASLAEVGTLVGSAELQHLADKANRHTPVLHTHDRFGQRVDRVEYHASYHELMRLAYASGVHSMAWIEDRPGAHVARAAMSYLWNQCENGIGCPISMSYAIVPLLRANPAVGSEWEPGVLSPHYDPRHAIASFAPLALCAMKANLHDAERLGLSTYLTVEAGRYATNGRSADSREAAAAFLEKRTPVFTGR
jgi:hypothetical protein